MRNREPAHLALFVPDLRGGGVANVIVTLAGALAERGHRVDLVLCRASGPFMAQVPDSVQVVELHSRAPWLLDVARVAPKDILSLVLFSVSSRRILETLPHLRALAHYLKRERPVALLAAKPQAALAAIWGTRLAATTTRVVTSIHTDLSAVFANRRGWRFLAPAFRRNWRQADKHVAVSNGVADSLVECAGVARNRIATIYNGMVNAESVGKAGERVDHAWFQVPSAGLASPRHAPDVVASPASPIPVLLSVARLEPQKNVALLLRAFARVRAERETRLVILGEGPLRTELETLARSLGIDGDVDMPGFVGNPSAYMAQAAAFVLSSSWEGLSNVIIEALVAGCPVVSTNCPSGPAEILEDGAYGRLVPVGDVAALASAIVATLDEPPCRARLQHRAQRFSTDRMAEEYLHVLLDNPAIGQSP